MIFFLSSLKQTLIFCFKIIVLKLSKVQDIFKQLELIFTATYSDSHDLFCNITDIKQMAYSERSVLEPSSCSTFRQTIYNYLIRNCV